MIRQIVTLCWVMYVICSPLLGQASREPNKGQLQFVIYLSRHGVRSPTGKAAQYSVYSKGSWPIWDVPPGYLTKHGYHLMELFGAYDRLALAQQGLVASSGCADAVNVTFYADSDQRTRETGKALAAGMFPGCSVPVRALEEQTNDPLFHPVKTKVDSSDSRLAFSALAGRIGNDPQNLTEAHRAQLSVLDKLLETCGTTRQDQKRVSLFEIPSTLSMGQGDHLVDIKGPLSTAGTFTENFLLEYTEGMDTSSVGWGCVDGAAVRTLIDLHTASVDFAQRTPAIAKRQASNLLDQVHLSLNQAIIGKPITGALGKPMDKVLFLIGHDTNLTNIAGLLRINWIIDGRRDDTPPGGSLIFELWKTDGNKYSVRTYYTAQTLEQMRNATELSLAAPPPRIPIFIPDCSKNDFSCDWDDFSRTLLQLTGGISTAGKAGTAELDPDEFITCTHHCHKVKQ